MFILGRPAWTDALPALVRVTCIQTNGAADKDAASIHARRERDVVKEKWGAPLLAIRPVSSAKWCEYAPIAKARGSATGERQSHLLPLATNQFAVYIPR